MTKEFKFKTRVRKVLADLITPVSIYLKIRDNYPNSILLESSDYRANANSFSFICFQPLAQFKVEGTQVETSGKGMETISQEAVNPLDVPQMLQQFISSFEVEQNKDLNFNINGVFGYSAFDAVRYFDTYKIKDGENDPYYIPEIRYCFYQYVIAINHFKNELYIIEYTKEDEASQLDVISYLIQNRSIPKYEFSTKNGEVSNVDDAQFIEMVKKGKQHCRRGDVIQIVLSRQFKQQFTGDEFNVYRSLRSINPSPYLYFFDYGNYRIFGSSPETQLLVNDGLATINPIAGTFRRTGNDADDEILAQKLSVDEKENAEHVMLVDLARNDLARNSSVIKVEKYREVQFYSHVIHLVSKVTGKLLPDTSTIKVMADSFPAGTLSGAPKYSAIELINKIENQNRGYYGGCIGFAGFNGDFNQAIMIRSFLSKNNVLYYQAGAGVVDASDETSELNEVNNKLSALKQAIVNANEMTRLTPEL